MVGRGVAFPGITVLVVSFPEQVALVTGGIVERLLVQAVSVMWGRNTHQGCHWGCRVGALGLGRHPVGPEPTLCCS